MSSYRVNSVNSVLPSGSKRENLRRYMALIEYSTITTGHNIFEILNILKDRAVNAVKLIYSGSAPLTRFTRKGPGPHNCTGGGAPLILMRLHPIYQDSVSEELSCTQWVFWIDACR